MVMLYWVSYLKAIDIDAESITRIFQREFNHYLNKAATQENLLKRLHLWSKLLRKSPLNALQTAPYAASIVGYQSDHLYSDYKTTEIPALLPRFFQLLGRLCNTSKTKIKAKNVRKLFHLQTYGAPEDPVYEYFIEASKVRESLKYLYKSDYRQLHTIAQGNAKLFGYCYKLWTVPTK